MPHNGEERPCFVCSKQVDTRNYEQVGLHFFHPECFIEWQRESSFTRLQLREVEK